MLSTTAGQVLVNETLPPELRRYDRVLGKKESKELFQTLAEKYPEKYREISAKLMAIGGRAFTETGGMSFGTRHMTLPPNAAKYRTNIRQEVQNILANTNLSDVDRDKHLIESMQRHAEPFAKKIFSEALEAKNPIAMQIESGAKGSPSNLRSVVGGDLLYEGHKGQPIPFPILRGFAEGYRPAEYWAHTYGARKGVIDLKFATQEAGYFGKQLNQISHRLVVTSKDHEVQPDHLRGYPVDVDDSDNEGSLLAHDVGGFKKNTVLTPAILAELKSKGNDKILVRSPILSGPPNGGVYANDVGIRERGGLAPIGDYVGMSAAQALAEPVTQAQISSKHTGGVAGAGGAISGFKTINQLFQVPKTYTGGASHAQVDGKVGAIYPAPAGGTYVMVNGERHYVAHGQNATVKSGDVVEAGDVMSDGLPNPDQITHHKGIGEGRRYFIDTLRHVYKNSDISTHRRNIELMARGLINHVELREPMGDYMPEDIVPYDVLEHSYIPRDGHVSAHPKKVIGHYLEKPVLHYTIGTQVKPNMVKELEHFGVKEVFAHPDPPPFAPTMIRAAESLQHDPDWMTRMLGSNQKKSLLTAAHRGLASNTGGTSFVPSLAAATTFAREGQSKGWTAGESFLGGTPTKTGSVLDS